MYVIAFGCVESAGEVKETVSRASGEVIVDYPVCNWKCGTDPSALVENWILVG